MPDYKSAVLKLNPVGYWRLGESSGTNAVDLGSGVHDGTYTNTPTLGVTGALTDDTDTAVTFASASSENVNMGDVLGFEYNLPFTISFWYKTTATSLQHMVGKQQSTGDFVGVSVATAATGEVDLQVVNTPATNLIRINTTATGFNDGNWHHVVVTYDGSTNASGINIYVDGVDEALTTVSDNLSATIASTAKLSIASRNSAAGYFDGSVDEVAIFDEDLTAQDAARLYYTGLGHFDYYPQDALSLGPVGYWRLGEASGTSAVDATGNNNGTYTNTPTLGVTGALSEDTDTAVTCTAASSEYVTMGDVLDFDYNEPFSLACWFKTTSVTTHQLVGKQETASNYRGYGLMVTQLGDILFSLRNTEPSNKIQTGTTAQTFDDDLWHFVVVTYDGSTNAAGVTIYVDGVAEAQTTTADTLSATTISTADFNLAARGSADLHLDGELDEVAIYDKELSALDALRLYVSGTYTAPTTAETYANAMLTLRPLAYWRLGEPSGTVAADEMGGTNGTYTNTPTLGVTGALTDDTDTAVTFASASSETVDMGDVLDFEYSDPYSYSIWFKTASSLASSLISKMESTAEWAGHDFRIETTGALTHYIRYTNTPDKQAVVTTTTTGFNDDAWHYAVVTYDGSGAASGITIYVDGVTEALTTSKDTLGTDSLLTTAILTIGGRNSATQFFNGSLDEAAIFNYALDKYDVATLFSVGNGYRKYAHLANSLAPVGYWRLGEPSGTVATDIAPGGTNGTYTNTPTLAQPGALSEDTDTAVSFASATSEYVTMGDVLDFARLDPFTLCGWFKTNTAANQVIVSKEEGTPAYAGYDLRVNSTGGITFNVSGDATGDILAMSTTANTFADDTWHFVMATYDGSSSPSGVTIYVDGASEVLSTDVDNLSTTTLNAAALSIGRRSDASLYFDGELDEIAVYDRVLSNIEQALLYAAGTYVTTVPGLDADYRNTVLGLCPLGYWRLGEASGTNAVDETLRNDGTYTNTPTLGVTGALTGDTDTAVTFAQATSEYVTMVDVLDITYDTAFSLSIWGKTTYSATTQALIGKMDHVSPYGGYELRQETTGALSLFIRYSETTNDRILVRTTATTFNDGNWHHVVATYTGSGTAAGVSIYIDGVDQALTTVTDNLGTNSLATAVSFNVGARNGGGEYFDGSLDEAAMFGSALTAKDVAAMYYMGLGKTGYEYEVLKLAPTSYWRLGEPSGTTAVDEVGNYNGTYVNTPALGAASLVPVDGDDTAVTFAGASTEYVSMGDNLEFAYNEPFSFCFWVNTTDTAGAYIAKYNDLTPKGFTFHVNTSQLAFIWRNTVTSDEMKIFFNSSAAIFDGNDHFAVMTYDGSTNASGVNFYLDGVLQVPTVGADTLSSTPSITDVFCLAAQRAGNNVPLTGTMDEVAVFLHELTAQEAHDIYTYGKQYRSAQTSFTSAMWEARPVGWWKLGEGSGTVAADELGLNDGTYTNTPTLGVAGAIASETGDTAASFASASSEYVTMGDVLDFDRLDPFTLCVWFKTGTAATQAILRKSRHAIDFIGYGINILSTGEINFTLTNDSVGGADIINVKTTATTFGDDAWHHVVVTYDGSSNASGVAIYIDGINEALTITYDTLTSTTLNTYPLQLGARNSTDIYFNGELDEAAIFDYELTGAQVRRIFWEAAGYSKYSLAQLINQPVGYWRLGEASGTNAVDVIGTNDGTYTNTPTLGVAGAITNDDDTAVTFLDTSSEYVTMGNVLAFDRTDPFSLCAWISTSESASSMGVLGKYDATANRGYAIYVSNGTLVGIAVNTYTSNGIRKASTATVADGAMHFIALTYDGSSTAAGLKLFIDGVEVATSTTFDTLSASITHALPFTVGSLGGTANYFDGTIDEPVIYGKELTAPEICEIYFASLLTYAAVDGGGAQYSEVVSESPSIGSLVGATADHVVTDASDFTQVIITHWGRTVSESFNWEVGIGIITTITESTNFAVSADAVRYMIGSAVEAVQFALTENIETAKGVLEGLAMNEAWAASTILQGNLSETLSYADVIRLTWDQLETETVNVTDSNTVYAQKAAALAELFVSAGIVSTIHKAAGIIAEAIILQDLVERFFELSVVDTVHLTDAEATLYRAVAANIEAAAMADSLTGTRRLSLLVSDALTGGDTDILNVICRTLAEDDVIFGGAISLPDGVFSAIVLNTESMGISEYSNYPFNSFGKLENDYLGASDTDIYKLTGDDDAGTDIDAVIRTGMTNFGTNVFKRVPRAYLGYTSDGGLIMKTISTSGGTKTERWYELTPRTGDHASAAPTAARIKLGRGIKATYWQFELINKLGSDFDIDMLQLYPMILSRRV